MEQPNQNNQVRFYKYQGAGNDFILVDNRDMTFKHQGQQKLLSRLCDRRFGVGGDGIIVLESKKGYDFQMIYYNSDGKISSMCGNGGRCMVAFAKHLGIIDEETNFIAPDGPHYAKISKTGDWISLQMINVNQISKDENAFVLNTGSPHFVTFVENLKSQNVPILGKEIRNSARYCQEGINVNFVEVLGDYCHVRTYERGVEDETYACGTGVTAVAIVLAHQKGIKGEHTYNFKVAGGQLAVRFSYNGIQEYTNVFLEGPAKLAFKGEFDIEALDH